MIGSAFWSALDIEGRIGFARAIMSHADNLAAYLHTQERAVPSIDLSFLDGDERLDIQEALRELYGSTNIDDCWDEIFQDLQLPVDPMAVPDDTDRLTAAQERYGDIFHMKKRNPSGLPRLMVMGHARHGKDTVCDIMERLYGLRWVSSSWKCAEKVIGRLVLEPEFEKDFLDSLPEGKRAAMNGALKHYRHEWTIAKSLQPVPEFVNWVFEVRGEYRELWYLAIRWYNWGDATKLCREIMDEADAYCGIRDARELNAIWNSGLLDDAIWVDASKRVAPESPDSISITPAMASLHLDNNHDLERLELGVVQLMWGQYGLLPKV